MRWDSYGWGRYVTVAERRKKAADEISKLRKKGHTLSPVTLEGRAIARTFWGEAWCDNLERYSDYSNRLPRGQSYVRNGSVIDLQIAAGAVTAMVSGSRIYQQEIKVSPIRKARWTSICKETAGSIDSLVELLQGRFSKGVMQRICKRGDGLFPTPSEISFSCSCPDWATMCKHVAAALYGVGARLDDRPELLFTLRKVDGNDLIAKAGSGLHSTRKGPAAAKILKGADFAQIFGLELANDGARDIAAPIDAAKPKRAKAGVKKPDAAMRVTSRRTSKRAMPRPKGKAKPGTTKRAGTRKGTGEK